MRWSARPGGQMPRLQGTPRIIVLEGARRVLSAAALYNRTDTSSLMRPGESGLGLAILAASLLSILAINRDAPLYTNADSILFPIMSLQHVTPFYWGQDRIANFVPLILSPVGSNKWNLLLNLLIFTLAFFWFVILAGYWMFRIAFPMASTRQCQAFTAVLLLITVLIIKPDALFVMSGWGNPYALSYLTLLVAVRLAMKRLSPVNTSASVGCLAIAVGLNPSVVITALFASVMLAYFRYLYGATLIAFSSFVNFEAWLFLKRLGPPPTVPISYSGINLHDINAALMDSAKSMMSSFHLIVLAIFGIVFGAIALLRASSAATDASYRRVFATLLAFGSAWWLAFSVNSWVLANISSFRYFFPAMLILCALVSLLIAGQLLHWPMRLVSCAGLLCLVLAAGALYAPLKPISRWPAFQRVEPYAAYARQHGIRLIAGDYWVVWPTVFRLLDTREAAFGLAVRGGGNEGNLKMFLDSQLSEGRYPDALCVDATTDACVGLANSITKLHWMRVPGTCPGTCSLMEVAH